MLLSLLDQCIAFYLGQKLTYDKVLDVLGTVDTEVFSRLLRRALDRDAAGCIRILEEMVVRGREMGQFVNDFTWYLRNLLLVKSSDELEDVLDVSTENLRQLKEESTMVEFPALMRYIRNFFRFVGTDSIFFSEEDSGGDCAHPAVPSADGERQQLSSGTDTDAGGKDGARHTGAGGRWGGA